MEKNMTPRSQAKRAAILDAAKACFLDLGYSKTSMDAVAQQAAVSKATIYAHFDSKSDLFTAIIRQRCDDYSSGLTNIVVPKAPDIRQALEQLARHLLTFLTQPEVMAMYRMVIAESSHQPELAQLFYDQGPLRGRARLRQIFQQLMESGLMPPGDPEQMSECMTGILRGDYYHRTLLGLPPRPEMDMERTIMLAVDVLLNK